MGSLPFKPRWFWKFLFIYIRMQWIKQFKSYLWGCLNLLESVSLLETHAMELHSRVTSEVNLWKCRHRCLAPPPQKRKGRRERGLPFTQKNDGSEIMWDGEMERLLAAVGLSSCMPCLVWAAHSVDASLVWYSSETKSVFNKAPNCKAKPRPTFIWCSLREPWPFLPLED